MDEGVCGLLEVFDADRHAQDTVPSDIALSLSLDRLDKGFGCALGH